MENVLIHGERSDLKIKMGNKIGINFVYAKDVPGLTPVFNIKTQADKKVGLSITKSFCIIPATFLYNSCDFLSSLFQCLT